VAELLDGLVELESQGGVRRLEQCSFARGSNRRVVDPGVRLRSR